VKREGRKASLHCALYTRVSTENGLEQEFNSLDNQREASEAYIRPSDCRFELLERAERWGAA
jgi:DNA invertase Pin-like site-specific DNA recombinase